MLLNTDFYPSNIRYLVRVSFSERSSVFLTKNFTWEVGKKIYDG